MIIELLIILLTPIATYSILRSFNVSKPLAVIISLIYTALLYTGFTWIMVTYGVLMLVLPVLVLVILLLRRS